MSKPSLDFLFHPRSVALAGASADMSKPSLAQFFVLYLEKFGYTGKIYPLHPAGGELYGKKVYRNVKEIEGEVDYVVSAIPAKLTPQLIRDCADKRVKAVHLFTSGYSEIEDEIGGQLEKEILEIARKGGVRLVGPNCMGIYCPSAGMTFAGDYPEQKGFPNKPGHLGLISQSGGNAIYFIRQCVERGVFFSKAVSYGNAADINECDYLEYMAEDPDTELIAMYIEGVRDGRRFRQVLSRAVGRKPVIVYKGGSTESGARTCSTHTASIAGSAALWRDFLRQTGAVQVYSMDELADAVVAFSKMKLPAGRNIVAMGNGGGAGVYAADEITAAGLHLPLLPVKVRRKLHDIFGTEAGSIFRNPVDIPPIVPPDYLANAARAIAAADEVDAMILHFAFDMWALIVREVPLYPFTEMVNKLAGNLSKPFAIVLHTAVDPKARVMADETQARFVELGLPVFPSFSRAAHAISRYIGFYERRRQTEKLK